MLVVPTDSRAPLNRDLRAQLRTGTATFRRPRLLEMSPRSCAVLLWAEADQSGMTAAGESHAALISAAARVATAAATARVRSPRVANWGRQPGTKYRRPK
jgi:hypothetical protein